MPTVLVIDDDDALTEMVSTLLTNAGFKVEAAASGPEGLQKAISEQPDVVIVDVMMPEMDGYKVCDRLRSDPRTARSAIIILTARGQPVDRGMALRSGADQYMVKPFKGKALVDQVQELTTKRPRSVFPWGFQVVVLRLEREAGATTLVTNLAFLLAKEKDRLTVAADMDFQGGQLSDGLGLPSTAAGAEPPGSDADWVATHLACHSSGLFALPAPEPTSGTDQPVPEVEQLLPLLRDWYDYVVLDTPLNLGPLASVLLGSSSLILLLLTPDTASLRKAELSLAAIERFGKKPLRVWPVLNMVRPEQGSFHRQVEKGLGLPVMAVLPWSPEECEEAVSSRRPVVQGNPKSLFSIAIQTLAEEVAQAASTGSQETPR